MTVPDNWYELLGERIERARALGWTAEPVGHYFVMNDPDGIYGGLGESEYAAFLDILADHELWDEVTKLLYPDDASRKSQS